MSFAVSKPSAEELTLVSLQRRTASWLRRARLWREWVRLRKGAILPIVRPVCLPKANGDPRT